MTRRPRVGLVGFGAIGRHHARNLATLDQCEFVGVAEADTGARCDASRAGYGTFGDLDELLSKKLDGVVLAVPTSLHRDMAMEAISASCALLVEKPLASDVTSAEAIIQAARGSGVPLMIGYVERYNPAVIAFKNFIHKGNLGRPFLISARRVGIMPARIRDANVLIDIGVHDIDLVAFLTDKTLTLRLATGGRAVLQDRIDYASLTIDAEGIAVQVESNWITPVKIRELFVTGENGACHLDYITQTARFAATRDFESADTFEGIVAQYRAGEFVELAIKKEEPLRRELRVFIESLGGGELPDPRLALVSLRIAEEATLMIESRVASGPTT